MIYNKADTQTHAGFEQYYYVGNGGTSTLVPKIFYKDKKNWYTEVRYNYDDLQTFSVNVGKMYSKKNKFSYSLTPLAGAIIGRLNGGSIGLNMDLDYRSIYFSSESQYTFSTQSKTNDFFFSWSELGYQFTNHFYSGLALQQTRFFNGLNKWEPGVTAGASFNKFTFPLYAFNPVSNKRYFVLGINMEWSYSKSKKTNYTVPALAEAHKQN